MALEFHVNGLARIYINVTGSPTELGYSQDGVTIELHYETEDIMTDKSGAKIPEDIQNMGQWATVKCNLIKYDTSLIEYLQNRLNEVDVAGKLPNVRSNITTGCPNAIAELMGQCNDFSDLWIRRCNPACEGSIEGGWHFYNTYLADIDTFKVGTRVTIHDLTFRCLPGSSGILYTTIGTAAPSV